MGAEFVLGREGPLYWSMARCFRHCLLFGTASPPSPFHDPWCFPQDITAAQTRAVGPQKQFRTRRGIMSTPERTVDYLHYLVGQWCLLILVSVPSIASTRKLSLAYQYKWIIDQNSREKKWNDGCRRSRRAQKKNPLPLGKGLY